MGRARIGTLFREFELSWAHGPWQALLASLYGDKRLCVPVVSKFTTVRQTYLGEVRGQVDIYHWWLLPLPLFPGWLLGCKG